MLRQPAIALFVLACMFSMQPANATPPDGAGRPPSASIRTLERSVSSDWTGSGDIAVGTNLCIESTTGSYRLTLSMPGLFRSLATDGRISFRFTDATGAVQVAPLTNGSTVEFVGTTIGRGASDCANGKYALLQALIPQDVLTAQQAGDYMSQITLSVAPA